jgi:hypothetical protein
MRASALAAVCGAALLVSGVAAAEQWTDPNGRLTFNSPAGWSVQERRAPEGMTAVIAGTANNECMVISQQNAGTTTAQVAAIRAAAADDAQFGADAWTRIANGMSSVFPDNSANVQSRSSETGSDGWPIQRAEIQSPERMVHAAMQMRPGFDLITMCMTYGGADSMSIYDPVIRSVGHPNDAAWEAAAAPAALPPAQ